MIKKDLQTNERTRFTRMCIGESVIDLMKHTELSRIRISAIARKAGVSRMTFYHYYSSVRDVLNDYMNEIIYEYLCVVRDTPTLGSFCEYSHLLFSLNFFDKYRDFFLVLVNQGQHSILINSINRFMIAQPDKVLPYKEYELYYYAGGLLNIFLEWQKNGKKETPEEITSIILTRLLRSNES